MDKRRVLFEENTFKLLMTWGVTSKLEYDAAPRQPGRFVRNVEGLHHFKICKYRQYFMKESLGHTNGCREILDEIQAEGPVHGWFIYDASFLVAANNGTIFYQPKEEEEEEELSYYSESGEEELSYYSESSSGEAGGSDSSGDSDDDEQQHPVVRPKTHAVLIFGFGSRGRRGLFDYQNNWGLERSRGLMEAKNIISVIAPSVSFESLRGYPEPADESP